MPTELNNFSFNEVQMAATPLDPAQTAAALAKTVADLGNFQPTLDADASAISTAQAAVSQAQAALTAAQQQLAGAQQKYSVDRAQGRALADAEMNALQSYKDSLA